MFELIMGSKGGGFGMVRTVNGCLSREALTDSCNSVVHQYVPTNPTYNHTTAFNDLLTKVSLSIWHRHVLRHLHLLRRFPRDLVLRARQRASLLVRLLARDRSPLCFCGRPAPAERLPPLDRGPGPSRLDLPRLVGRVQRVFGRRRHLPWRVVRDARRCLSRGWT